jgi:2-haloalkanoic acid dehalogenase type II
MGQKIEAVFLDFYGTVAGGDRQAVERACAGVVRDFQLAMTPPEFAIHWGEVFFAMMGRHNGDQFLTLHELEIASLRAALGERNGHQDLTAYVRELETYWADPPIHADAVEFLQQVGVPVCCVSNADDDHLVGAIAKHGLEFAGVVSSEASRSYKPDPHIFKTALDVMQCRPDRVLHVGDSLHSDIGGAQPFGIRTAWICRDDRIHDVGAADPDYKISRLTDLLALL